jgi:hypothetical protein
LILCGDLEAPASRGNRTTANRSRQPPHWLAKSSLSRTPGFKLSIACLSRYWDGREMKSQLSLQLNRKRPVTALLSCCRVQHSLDKISGICGQSNLTVAPMSFEIRDDRFNRRSRRRGGHEFLLSNVVWPRIAEIFMSRRSSGTCKATSPNRRLFNRILCNSRVESSDKILKCLAKEWELDSLSGSSRRASFNVRNTAVCYAKLCT